MVSEPAPPAYMERLQSALYKFPENGAILHREPVVTPKNNMELARQYRRPSLREVDLGFSGRQYGKHPVHRAIAALSTGDPLETRINEKGRWELLDGSGTVVGRLAGAFEPPAETRCASATVYAIVTWSRDASEPGFRKQAECDTWEVVAPEVGVRPYFT